MTATAMAIEALIDGRLRDAIKALAMGNPGALRVCCELAEEKASGPQRIDGPMYLAWVAETGLAGPDIWIAYKDVCRENLDELKARLRESRAELRRAVQEAGAL